MLAHYDIKTGVNMFRKHIGWYTHGPARRVSQQGQFHGQSGDVKARS
jgi:tRNA-dihydrouridine synthase B